MKLMGLAGISALALATLLPGQAHALATGTPALVCNGCPNPIIFERLRDEYPTYDTQYVLDFDRPAVRRFSRTGQNWREIAVDPPEQNYFNLLVDFRNRNGGSLVYIDRQDVTGNLSSLALRPHGTYAPDTKATATITSDLDSVSAWDVANSGNSRNVVTDQLNATRDSLWTRIAGNTQMAVGSVRMLFGVDNPVDVRLGVHDLAAQVEVAFKDGSRSRFSWDPYNKTFEYVPHSSRDSDSNTIPDTADDVTGGKNQIREYRFSGTPTGVNNSIRFYDRVQAWGVSSPTPSAPSVLACTQVDGGPRICHLAE